MHSKTKFFGLVAICAVTAAGACSQSPQTPLSPSASLGSTAALNPDGSSLKITAPVPRSPIDNATVSSRRPRLDFANSVGRHVQLGFYYEIEIRDEPGNLIYSNNTGESPAQSGHDVQTDLNYATHYWWRVRGRIEGTNETGPWSEGLATFRTPDPPPPPPPPTTPPPGSTGLPFPVPEACSANIGPSDRSACVSAMTAVSPWWDACRAGSGTNCHRFTRSVAAALATGDPGWGLLTKNPGEQQCSWNSCGSGNGSGYGEDVVTHWDGRTLRAWDIVGGAGAPGATAGWSRIESFRGGNNWAPVPLPLGTQ